MHFSSILAAITFTTAIATSPQVLTEANFDQVTKGFNDAKPWFIKFYAPWCPHCKSVAPTWIDLVDAIPDVSVAEVDCTTDKPLCRRYGITGYPSLMFFKDGKMYKYGGARTVAGMTKFVREDYQTRDGTEIPTVPSHQDL